MMKFTKLFVSKVEVKNGVPNFPIDLVRKSLRGSGFCLRLRGRHPNRKSFFPNLTPFQYRYSVGQDFPLSLSTTCAIYLKPSSWNRTWHRFPSNLENAKNEVFQILNTKTV